MGGTCDPLLLFVYEWSREGGMIGLLSDLPYLTIASGTHMPSAALSLDLLTHQQQQDPGKGPQTRSRNLSMLIGTNPNFKLKQHKYLYPVSN